MTSLAAHPKHPVSLALAQYAFGLPHVSCDIKWQSNLVFTLEKKMFCVVSLDEQPFEHISCKVPVDQFLSYTAQAHIIPAPYLARAHWVTLTHEKALSLKDSKALIRQSYQLIFAKLPKFKQQELSG